MLIGVFRQPEINCAVIAVGGYVSSSPRDNFKTRLTELCARFGTQAREMRTRGYDEATLRLEYLDPLFSSLGWNVWNNPPQPLHMRDVVVENRTEIRGRAARVDYLFRTGGLDRWICEAKKPFDSIDRHSFQLQNYTYNMRLWLGVLSDFEYFIVFVVGGKPSKERPFSPTPGWRLHYSNYVALADQIWDLFSKDAVENGSLERYIQGLGKISTKAKQGWLLKPDRTKTVDTAFLAFLEEQRRLFAKDLVKRNAQVSWTGPLLADCLQAIFDRLLFQRVSEDRGIDVGTALEKTLNDWEGRGKLTGQLWPMVAANFRHLAATFNGGVYGKDARHPHHVDTMAISDGLLADFIDEIAGDSSEWLFGTMPLWILGSVYERFLGSDVDSSGNVGPKPQARKAGGVYYTPEPVVRQIVDLTVGSLLQGKTPTQVLKLRVIDPACGSGSFLLVVFDRFLQHCLDWFSTHRADATKGEAFEQGGRLWLTTSFKRKLLRSCIYGIDIDPVAVQVARMSLCLKVLEDETQEALTKEKSLFPKDRFLPDLDENVVHANSLIPVSAYPEYVDEHYLANCNALDLKALLANTERRRGFDAVVGNPPWGAELDDVTAAYARVAHRDVIVRMPDTYIFFAHMAVNTLLRDGGVMGLVLPGTLLNQADAAALRRYLMSNGVEAVADLGQGIFGGALNTTCIIVARKSGSQSSEILINDIKAVDLDLREAMIPRWSQVDRSQWETAVKADPGFTFFTGNLDRAAAMSSARNVMGRLGDLVDDLGIQRGVTPDVIEAHILTPPEAEAAQIESEVLRKTLRGEDVKAFHPAQATMRIIYTTSETNPTKVPHAIAYLKKFRSQNSCPEVKAHKHPWWRLHRPRKAEIFSRPKIIGLTTTRNIELVWDANEELVVTDAMYVFTPSDGIPHEYVMGLMHSQPFADFYRLANQGDARVIPQVKATKLLDVPIPAWDSRDRLHTDLVKIVRSIIALAQSKAPGADRGFAAQRRELNRIAAAIYGVEERASEPLVMA